MNFSDYIAACPPRECDKSCFWVKDWFPDCSVLRCIMCNKWSAITESTPNDDAATLTKLKMDRAQAEGSS